MHSLQISDFFETNLLRDFYSISNKDMSSGNLDISGHTLSNNSKKIENISNFNVLQVYLEYTR